MIKAIFFDIDGTLVSFQTHKISDNTKLALRLAAEKGIKLFISTGRQRREAENAIGELIFDGFITANGQYCYAGEKIIRKQAIDKTDLYSLLKRLEHNPYPCEFVEENGVFLNIVNNTVLQAHKAVALALPEIRNISDIAEREIFQMVSFFDSEHQEEEMAILPHCEATRWSPYFADVVPKGGNKRVGMEAMLQHFSISPDEIMAFGDGENDISMLQYASIGIAMGNSSQIVKDAAKDVTDSVDDSGIYNALKRYGII